MNHLCSQDYVCEKLFNVSFPKGGYFIIKYSSKARVPTYIGDTLEQVLDVAADGPDGGDLLLLSEPLLDLHNKKLHTGKG